MAPIIVNILRTIVQVPERSHEKPIFRAALGPEAAPEEDLDVLENKVAGLLHLEGESVAVAPKNNEEESLGEVSKGCEVRSNTYRALHITPSPILPA